MNVWMILGGLLPLVLFVIVDSFCGLRKGIIAAAIAAIFELILSLVMFNTVDALTIGSLLLVVVMGIAAWKMNSATVFKMQPVVVGMVISCILVGSYWLDRPVLTLLFVKYKDLMPKQIAAQVTNPIFLKLFNLSTLYCGMAIFAQTALVAWAALMLNNWWWIAFRGIGFYVFITGGFLLARYHTFSQ